MNNLENSKFFSFDDNIADLIINNQKIYVLLKKKIFFLVNENHKEKFLLQDENLNKKFILIKKKPLIVLIEKENGTIKILKLKKNQKPILIYEHVFERKISFQNSFFFEKYLCLNEKKGIFFYEINEEFSLKKFKELKDDNFNFEYLINFYFFKKNKIFVFIGLNDKNEFIINKNEKSFIKKFANKESIFSFQYFLLKENIRIFFVTNKNFYFFDFNLENNIFSDFKKINFKNIEIYENYFLDINYHLIKDYKKLLLIQNSNLNIYDSKFKEIKNEKIKITKLIDKDKYFIKSSKNYLTLFFKNKLIKYKISIINEK